LNRQDVMVDLESTLDRFQSNARQLDTMVRDFDTLPYPRIRDRVTQLLQSVDALHREPLQRLMDLLRLHASDGLIDRLLEDEAVRSLLLLYDLIPAGELAQVEAALDPVRTQLHPYGSDVEVLSVTDGAVHVRLHGGCSDCPSSAAALQSAVDAALRDGFPGYRSVHIHPSPPPGVSDLDGGTAAQGGAERR
jgi:Fe-S cluster biogenesis protein NfuA